MSIFYLTADAVNSGSWFIVFKVLTLKVAIWTIYLHLSKLSLGYVADFLNTEARAPTSAECIHCLLAWRLMWFGCIILIRVMVIFCWLFFFINGYHPYRRVAVISWLNYLILGRRILLLINKILLPSVWGSVPLAQLQIHHISHPPCCILRFHLLYASIDCRIFSSLRDLSSDKPGQDILLASIYR